MSYETDKNGIRYTKRAANLTPSGHLDPERRLGRRGSWADDIRERAALARAIEDLDLAQRDRFRELVADGHSIEDAELIARLPDGPTSFSGAGIIRPWHWYTDPVILGVGMAAVVIAWCLLMMGGA